MIAFRLRQLINVLGAAGYADAEWRDWAVEDNSKAAGLTRTFGPLTFVTVLEAGHMVSPHQYGARVKLIGQPRYPSISL
jgi:carboxypeptidase C (cathepsin A)